VTGESVTLGFGEQRIELRVASAPPAPPRVAPQAVPQVETRLAGPSEDPTTPHRAMERREVERRLGAEIPRILAETAIQPVLQDGRVAGVMLTRVPEGSLLVDAGLRAGDVLTRINDVEIDGMATLIGLWPRLQGATEIRAVVLREGRPVTLGVTLR
jgi:S1-C subfamily serine protease